MACSPDQHSGPPQPARECRRDNRPNPAKVGAVRIGPVALVVRRFDFCAKLYYTIPSPNLPRWTRRGGDGAITTGTVDLQGDPAFVNPGASD
jgi:hypothetical protein